MTYNESSFFTRDYIDLMYDDVTRSEGSMGVVVRLKSKMAASSTSTGVKVK